MSLVYALMLGILGVLFGILVSNFIKTSSIAFCYLAIVFTCCMVYFLQIMHKKVNKKLSSRALNLILWMLPTLLPALWETNVKDYFIEDYISIDLIFTINVVLTFFCIFSLCIAIKKWKGIAVQ
jgi:ABC-type transport system involved in multi-copper enzyme maturation permease subunit